MKNNNMELRFNSDAKISSNQDGDMVVEGYVNETDTPSNTLGSKTKFVEIIRKGTWERALNRAKEVHFYAEHDKEKILASTRNGSLELREDERGLYMKATISPTTWGKDYYQLISDGILQNMSFGFRSVKDSWKNMGTHYVRTVEDLDLFEVSVVRDPAYSASSIAARGIDVVEDEVPEDIVENVIAIDLRATSDELDKLADKLFTMISEKMELTAKEDTNKDPDPEDLDDPVVDPEPVAEPEPEQEPDVDREPDTDPEEDTNKEEPKKESEAIRDFINKFKSQEEN